jgi:hypothetical protein
MAFYHTVKLLSDRDSLYFGAIGRDFALGFLINAIPAIKLLMRISNILSRCGHRNPK